MASSSSTEDSVPEVSPTKAIVDANLANKEFINKFLPKKVKVTQDLINAAEKLAKQVKQAAETQKKYEDAIALNQRTEITMHGVDLENNNSFIKKFLLLTKKIDKPSQEQIQEAEESDNVRKLKNVYQAYLDYNDKRHEVEVITNDIATQNIKLRQVNTTELARLIREETEEQEAALANMAKATKDKPTKPTEESIIAKAQRKRQEAEARLPIAIQTYTDASGNFEQEKKVLGTALDMDDKEFETFFKNIRSELDTIKQVKDSKIIQKMELDRITLELESKLAKTNELLTRSNIDVNIEDIIKEATEVMKLEKIALNKKDPVIKKFNNLNIEDKEAEIMLKVLVSYKNDSSIGAYHKNEIVPYAERLKELKDDLNNLKIQIADGDNTSTTRSEYDKTEREYNTHKEDLSSKLESISEQVLFKAKRDLIDEYSNLVDIVDSGILSKKTKTSDIEKLINSTKDKYVKTILQKLLLDSNGVDKINRIKAQRIQVKLLWDDITDKEVKTILEVFKELKVFEERKLKGSENLRKIIDYANKTFESLHESIKREEAEEAAKAAKAKLSPGLTAKELKQPINYAEKFKTALEKFKTALNKKDYEAEKIKIKGMLESLEPKESNILRQLQYSVVTNEYKEFEEAKITYTEAKELIEWFKFNKNDKFTNGVIASVLSTPSFDKWLQEQKTKAERDLQIATDALDPARQAAERAAARAATARAARIEAEKAEEAAKAKLSPGLTEAEIKKATQKERDTVEKERNTELGTAMDEETETKELRKTEQEVRQSQQIIANLNNDFKKFIMYIEHEATILQKKLETIDKSDDIAFIKAERNKYIDAITKFKDLLNLYGRETALREAAELKRDELKKLQEAERSYPSIEEPIVSSSNGPLPSFDVVLKDGQNGKRRRPPLERPAPPPKIQDWDSMSEKEKEAAQKAAEKAAAEEVYAARKAEVARARAEAARAEATRAEAAVRARGAAAAERSTLFASGETDKDKRAAAIKSIGELTLNSKESSKESIVHILKNGFNIDSVSDKNWRAQYLSLLILMYARNGDNNITITEKPKVESTEDSDKVFEHWAHCATEGFGLETDLKDGNTINIDRLKRAKNDIVTTIKTILFDDPSTPTPPISDDPYLVLENVAEIIMRVKEISKTDINGAEATKLAKWAISDDGINIIDEAIAEQNGLKGEMPEWTKISMGDPRTIETYKDVVPVAFPPDYGYYGPNVDGGTRKKLRKKQPRRKKSNRKQSTRKQPRRKQPRRKQSRRKQSTRKQPRRKQPRRKQPRRKQSTRKQPRRK